MVLAAAAPTMGGAGRAAASGAAGNECDPEVLLLPAPTETAGTSVHAINDKGMVVGAVSDFEQGVPRRAVMWTAMEPPTDLGIGGRERADGSEVYGEAGDVNEPASSRPSGG